MGKNANNIFRLKTISKNLMRLLIKKITDGLFLKEIWNEQWNK